MHTYIYLYIWGGRLLNPDYALLYFENCYHTTTNNIFLPSARSGHVYSIYLPMAAAVASIVDLNHSQVCFKRSFWKCITSFLIVRGSQPYHLELFEVSFKNAQFILIQRIQVELIQRPYVLIRKLSSDQLCIRRSLLALDILAIHNVHYKQ